MCFARGEHVAVGFVVECTGLDTLRERRAALQGVPIQRAVWNRSRSARTRSPRLRPP